MALSNLFPLLLISALSLSNPDVAVLSFSYNCLKQKGKVQNLEPLPEIV